MDLAVNAAIPAVAVATTTEHFGPRRDGTTRTRLLTTETHTYI